MSVSRIPASALRLFVFTLVLAIVSLQWGSAQAVPSCADEMMFTSPVFQKSGPFDSNHRNGRHEHHHAVTGTGELPQDRLVETDMCFDCSIMCMNALLADPDSSKRIHQVGRYASSTPSILDGLEPASLQRPPKS